MGYLCVCVSKWIHVWVWSLLNHHNHSHHHQHGCCILRPRRSRHHHHHHQLMEILSVNLTVRRAHFEMQNHVLLSIQMKILFENNEHTIFLLLLLALLLLLREVSFIIENCFSFKQKEFSTVFRCIHYPVIMKPHWIWWEMECSLQLKIIGVYWC